MAAMKPFVLLPFSLLAVSCIPSEPLYEPERSPYRNGAPRSPYAPAGPASGAETGQFEPVPNGNPPPPQTSPPLAPRPTSPRIDPEVNVPDTQPAPPPPRPTYPEARRTANPNQVISPYAPYNVIDVEGFKSGALAKDPSNGKIFRVP
jgi:hypothetical protein